MPRNKLRRVVLLLRLFHTALKIPCERLLSPRAFRGIANRGKRRRGLVRRLSSQINSERPMPSHAVPKDRLTRKILEGTTVKRIACDRKTTPTYDGNIIGLNHPRQLHRNMRVHLIVLRVLGIRSVEVKPRPSPKVPVGVFALDAGAAWRGVREQDGNALRCSRSKEGAFLSSETIRDLGELKK